MVSIELASMIFFFAIVITLLYRDKKNVQFSYGIVIRRWKRGKEIIDKIVNKRKRILSYAGTVGVVLGLLSSLLGMYFLISCAFFPQYLPKGVVQDKCFKLVLPSISGAEKYYPQQVLGIPFWYWLVSIFIIVFSHESMHAIFARLEKIPIKSYGLIFLLALPIGAFVDPDEKKLRQLGTFKKLRIYAAGSFGNFILALVVVGLILGTNYVSSALFQSGGVEFLNTTYNSPAYNVSLGGIIYQLNNSAIKSILDLENFLASVKPNDMLSVYTTAGVYNLTVSNHPLNSSRAYMGISDVTDAYKYKIFFHGYASDSTIGLILSWQSFLVVLFVLSLGVGIANMLPMKPFDGGLFFEDIFVRLLGKSVGKKLITIMSLMVFALILINLVFAPIKIF